MNKRILIAVLGIAISITGCSLPFKKSEPIEQQEVVQEVSEPVEEVQLTQEENITDDAATAATSYAEIEVHDKMKVDVDNTDTFNQKTQEVTEEKPKDELLEKYQNNINNIKFPTNYKVTMNYPAVNDVQLMFQSMDGKSIYCSLQSGNNILEFACDDTTLSNPVMKGAFTANGDVKYFSTKDTSDISSSIVIDNFRMTSISSVIKNGNVYKLTGTYKFGNGGTELYGDVNVGDSFIVQSFSYTEGLSRIEGKVQTILKLTKTERQFPVHTDYEFDPTEYMMWWMAIIGGSDVTGTSQSTDISSTQSSQSTISNTQSTTSDTDVIDTQTKRDTILDTDGNIKNIVFTITKTHADGSIEIVTKIKDLQGNTIDESTEWKESDGSTSSGSSESTGSSSKVNAPEEDSYIADSDGLYAVSAILALNENTLYENVKESYDSYFSDAFHDSVAMWENTEEQFGEIGTYDSTKVIITFHVTKDRIKPAQNVITKIAEESGAGIIVWGDTLN